MDKNFQWRDKSRGTFWLHGDAWFVYYSRIHERVEIVPNYNCYLGKYPRFSDAMEKTLEENKAEIESAALGNARQKV